MSFGTAQGDFRWRRHHEHVEVLGKRVGDLRQQVGVAHQCPRAAIGEDVGDLLCLQVPVDRHHRRADGAGCPRHLEESKIVAQHHGDRRALPEAKRLQPRRRTCDTQVQLGIADAAFAADDHRPSSA
jgi:hypothetical protein